MGTPTAADSQLAPGIASDSQRYEARRAKCARALEALAAMSSWEADKVRWLAANIDRYFGNLRSLEVRTSKPNQRGARQLRNRILDSYSGRLCAFLQEADRNGLKSLTPVTFEKLDYLINNSRPTRPIFDHAVVVTQHKTDGTKRITLSPGQKIRRAQRLVGDVLEASNFESPFEYSRPGRNSHMAVTEIVRLVEKKGLRDFVVSDVKNFFASVDADHLKGVPLPHQVIKHSVLFNRSAILLHDAHVSSAEAETARHGLPQGARVSGKLASSLLGRELRKLSGAMGIVAVVDDVVIGACDPAGAKALAQAIKLRFDNLSGGPWSLKKLRAVSINEGFSFVGYWLRLDKFSENPKVIIRPSHEAEMKFRKKLVRKLAKANPPDLDSAEAIAETYWKRWRAAFPLWHLTEAEQAWPDCLAMITAGDFMFGLKKSIQKNTTVGIC